MGKARKTEGEVDLNVAIPSSLKTRLEEYCEKNGLKIKFVVAKAIEEYLQSHEGP